MNSKNVFGISPIIFCNPKFITSALSSSISGISAVCTRNRNLKNKMNTAGLFFPFPAADVTGRRFAPDIQRPRRNGKAGVCLGKPACRFAA